MKPTAIVSSHVGWQFARTTKMNKYTKKKAKHSISWELLLPFQNFKGANITLLGYMFLGQ